MIIQTIFVFINNSITIEICGRFNAAYLSIMRLPFFLKFLKFTKYGTK